MEDFKRFFIRSSFLCGLLGMAEANLLADYLEGVNLITPYIWIGLGLVVMILFVVVYLLYILHHVSTHGNYQPMETRESVLARRIEQPVIDSFPSHPFQMQGGVPGSKRAECSICLQEFADGETVRTLPVCKHVYHPGCIRDWLTTKDSRCPYCRYDYGSKDHMPSSAGV